MKSNKDGFAGIGAASINGQGRHARLACRNAEQGGEVGDEGAGTGESRKRFELFNSSAEFRGDDI